MVVVVIIAMVIVVTMSMVVVMGVTTVHLQDSHVELVQVFCLFELKDVFSLFHVED